MTENDNRASRRERFRKERLRGHIPSGVFKQIIDHPEPAQEAEKQALSTAGIAHGLSGWAGRMQQRSRYFGRYMLAVQETAAFARTAFQQVADEATVDDETDEVVDTDARIKGLHPERELR